MDHTRKFSLYRRHGVSEYWAVDEANRLVTVWTGSPSPLAESHTVAGGVTIPSRVLPALKLEAEEIFAGIDEIPE